MAPLGVPTSLHLNGLVNALRRRVEVADRDFDAIYPEPVRARSSQYWTPVDVARRAATMLVTDPSTRVLDVGSGAGKFCLVGALTSPGRFTGIEQRGHLVEMSQAIARSYSVGRATYIHGDMRAIDWRAFDAIYLFNPFAENCFGAAEQLDDSVELTLARYERDVRYTYAALADARAGTRIVTYHGYGLDPPPTYERFGHELAGSELLELWIQMAR